MLILYIEVRNISSSDKNEINPIQYLIVGLLVLSLILSGISISLHLTKNEYVTQEDLNEVVNQLETTINTDSSEKVTIANLEAPKFVSTGNSFNASVDISNDQESLMSEEIKLKLNEEVMSTKEIQIPKQETKEIKFRLSPEEPGQYTLSVNEKTSKLNVASNELTIWTGWSGEEFENFKPVLNKFETKTGISWKHQKYKPEKAEQVLGIQFESEESEPDVAILGEYFIKQQAKDENLIPLDDIIDLENYREGIHQSVIVNDKLYSFISSQKYSAQGFYYKKSFFEENNLSEPETWAEFWGLMEKLEKIEGVRAPIGSPAAGSWCANQLEMFAFTSIEAKDYNNLITGKKSFNDTEIRQTLESTLVKSLKEGYYGKPTEWHSLIELWWNEEYGIMYQGSWLVTMVEDQNDLGMFTLPGQNCVRGFGSHWAIPKYAENPIAAKWFIKYLGSEEGQKLLIQNKPGTLATNINIGKEEYPPGTGIIREEIGDLPVTKNVPFKIGGGFYKTYWSQAKLLWSKPDQLDSILDKIEAEAISSRKEE